MKNHHLTRAGFWVTLVAAIVAVAVALMPEKSGIRLPVHVADGKIGYIDESGRMVLAAKWDDATPFNEDGDCFVMRDRPVTTHEITRRFPWFRIYRTSYPENWKMDRLGNCIPQIPYSLEPINAAVPEVKPNSHGLIMTKVRNEDPRINEVHWTKADGSEAFPGKWEEGIDFKNDDPAAVYKGGKWGFINRKGEPVTPIEWDSVQGFNGRGRACVSVNNKWGVINEKGELVVPLYFNQLSGFDQSDMCAASLESGSGFIDPNGKILIPFRHVRVEPFDHFGMAKVVMRNETDQLRVGWIDRTGELVIPCIYHDMAPRWHWDFKDHELLPVRDQDGFGLIDRKGRVVIPTGSADLDHIEDPIAPGKFWISSVPIGFIATVLPTFKPACYDQTGKLIWSGDQWTRARLATVLAVILGLVSATLMLFMLKGAKEMTNKTDQ